jgi:hypothetical protein
MGFNKCIVPSIDYLHGTIIHNGIQEVIKLIVLRFCPNNHSMIFIYKIR